VRRWLYGVPGRDRLTDWRQRRWREQARENPVGFGRSDSGTIEFTGQLVCFESPTDARENGIEMLYQDSALAPDLDAAANLFPHSKQKRNP